MSFLLCWVLHICCTNSFTNCVSVIVSFLCINMIFIWPCIFSWTYFSTVYLRFYKYKVFWDIKSKYHMNMYLLMDICKALIFLQCIWGFTSTKWSEILNQNIIWPCIFSWTFAKHMFFYSVSEVLQVWNVLRYWIKISKYIIQKYIASSTILFWIRSIVSYVYFSYKVVWS